MMVAQMSNINPNEHKDETPEAPRPLEESQGPIRMFSSTNNVDAQDQLDYWNYLQQPAFSLWHIDGEADQLNASVEFWHTRSVTFSDIQFRPSNGRPHAFEIGRLDREILTVRAFRKSDQRGLLGDEEVAFGSGEVHIYPYGQEARFITRYVDIATAYIPFSLIGYDPSISPAHLAFKAGSPVARVLTTTLCSALDSIRDATAEDAHALSQSIAGLVGGLIDSSQRGFSERGIFERERSAAVRSFIHRHLCNHDLTIDGVCSAFGASRATIYREFERDGGVARYIRRHRLQRAMLDLSMTRATRGLIADVAQKYGFQDVSSFSRAFRHQFGAAPSDYVGQAEGHDMPRLDDTSDQYSRSEARVDSWFALSQ